MWFQNVVIARVKSFSRHFSQHRHVCLWRKWLISHASCILSPCYSIYCTRIQHVLEYLGQQWGVDAWTINTWIMQSNLYTCSDLTSVCCHLYTMLFCCLLSIIKTIQCWEVKKVKVSHNRLRWPKGFQLRPWIFLTFSTMRVVGRQPYAPATFARGEIPGTHF
jgi:hypothetical protein